MGVCLNPLAEINIPSPSRKIGVNVADASDFVEIFSHNYHGEMRPMDET